MKVMFTTANKILGMGAGDGLYLSENNGDTWKAQENIPQISAIQFSNDRIYAASDGKGVYKFNGDARKSINDGLHTLKIFSIINFKNKLYCGTDQGVFLSKNDGKKWEPFNHGFEINKYLIISSLKVIDGILFAATEKGLYRVQISETN